MILTPDNYHSTEANREFLSVSQYKDFVGCNAIKGCEARALAKLNGLWVEDESDSMLVGSYVDAYFEGTLEKFKAVHPQIFTQKGELKAQYKKAEEIIARIERDLLFRQYMDGEKQVIVTGELFGYPWKTKIDSLHPHIAIVDLKIVKSIHDSFFVRDMGVCSFVEFWGYDYQLALYQAIYEKRYNERLPVYIAAADKGNVTDIELIGIDQNTLNNCINTMEYNIARIAALKAGELEPIRCGVCDYCKSTKILLEPVHFGDLLLNTR